MKSCIYEIFFVAVACLSFITNPAAAGVVMTYKDGATAYLQDGKGSHVEGTSFWSVLDGKKGEVTFVDSTAKSYASGPPEKICQSFGKLREVMMASIPPAQRSMVFGDGKPPKVTVKSLGGGGLIAGLPTNKYEVLKNGEKYSQVYISTDKKLLGAAGANWVTLLRLVAAFEGCMSMDPSNPETTEPYQKLLEKGIVLKDISSDASVSEVTKIEIKKIDDSKFQVPKGYKKRSFDEMLAGMMGG